ncbi:hypothetical protein B0H14DRAFT_3145532 [Mycena olivaceomarginata]|nr:hypothetical protein B0H14DRAFT_3145532 [Mycena olivaceomarginata]
MSATTPPPRQRVIDDSDPAIQYGPNGWFVADPSTLNGGNFGPIYQDTSHATTSSNSNLTFAFNGTSIKVLGTIMVSIDSNNVTDPTWDCFVDEIKISNPIRISSSPRIIGVLCEQPSDCCWLACFDNSSPVEGAGILLDYLMYTPPPDASFDTAVLLYPTTDPSVKFGTGWRTFGGENGTNDFGSEVSLAFHGTSVSPYGFVPTELSHNATWATYTIDGGPPVNFTLSGLPSPQSSTEYFVTLFTTPTIQSGPHSLVITYGGDNQHTPLVIQGFYPARYRLLRPLSSSQSSTSPPAPKKSTPAGAIAGGVIGGLLLLGLLTALAFFCAKRRHRRDLTSPTHTPCRTQIQARLRFHSQDQHLPQASHTRTLRPRELIIQPAPRDRRSYRGDFQLRQRGSRQPTIDGISVPASHRAGAAASAPIGHDELLTRHAHAPAQRLVELRGDAVPYVRQLHLRRDLARLGLGPRCTASRLRHTAAPYLRSSSVREPLRSGPLLHWQPRTVVLRHEDSGVRLRVPESGAARNC